PSSLIRSREGNDGRGDLDTADATHVSTHPSCGKDWSLTRPFGPGGREIQQGGAMRKLILVLAVAAAATLAGGASANTNLGGATSNADGTVTLNSSATPFSAGVDVSLPGVTFVGDISAFSVDYNFPIGCQTGVPILAIVTVR